MYDLPHLTEEEEEENYDDDVEELSEEKDLFLVLFWGDVVEGPGDSYSTQLEALDHLTQAHAVIECSSTSPHLTVKKSKKGKMVSYWAF